MTDLCKHCGSVDNWHHDLTECVTKLRTDLASSLARAEAAEGERVAMLLLFKWERERPGAQHIEVYPDDELQAYRYGSRVARGSIVTVAMQLGLLKPVEPLDKADG